MKFVGIESYDELSRADNLQEKLEDWIMSIKSQVRPNSVPFYFYGVKSFLEVNDVLLNWKKIIRLFPSKVKKTRRRSNSTR